MLSKPLLGIILLVLSAPGCYSSSAFEPPNRDEIKAAIEECYLVEDKIKNFLNQKNDGEVVVLSRLMLSIFLAECKKSDEYKAHKNKQILNMLEE